VCVCVCVCVRACACITSQIFHHCFLVCRHCVKFCHHFHLNKLQSLQPVLLQLWSQVLEHLICKFARLRHCCEASSLRTMYLCIRSLLAAQYGCLVGAVSRHRSTNFKDPFADYCQHICKYTGCACLCVHLQLVCEWSCSPHAVRLRILQKTNCKLEAIVSSPIAAMPFVSGAAIVVIRTILCH
jgi:hypothetical protein